MSAGRRRWFRQTSAGARLRRSVRKILLAVGVVAASGTARAQGPPRARPVEWIAVDVEAGAAHRSGAGDHWVPAVRAGVGPALIGERGFGSLTATVGYNPRPALTFGLVAEAIHFSHALGFSVASSCDVDGIWGLAAGPSFALLRLQGQLYFDDPRTKAVVVTLRIPLGLIAYALRGPATSPAGGGPTD